MNIHTFIGKKKFELDTPCLTIDINALRRNLNLMQEFGQKNNINIRPHCKTHKCSKLAQLQIEHGAIGVCAAKVSEAEVLINNGINNVLITSPIVTTIKLDRFQECLKKSPNTLLVVDNKDNLAQLNSIGENIKTKVNVLIDLDSGIGRTGIKNENAISFAKLIATYQWLNLIGIQCYAGNLQHIHSYSERKERSLKIMKDASLVLKQLNQSGFDCHILTGTGTGTYDIDIEDTQVSEIQPGSYAVMDVEYYEIESETNNKFDTFSNSMTLLTTVISSNNDKHVTVDAGTKGIYVDANHKPKIINHKGLHYDWNGFGDEHGKITADKDIQLPSNTNVLELIVPHCDPTINLYDYFFITENNIVIDVWEIDLRGKAQ